MSPPSNGTRTRGSSEPCHILLVLLLVQVVVHSADDGSCLGTHSAYDDALGIKAACWSPGGDVLAVGSYDQVGRRVVNQPASLVP